MNDKNKWVRQWVCIASFLSMVVIGAPVVWSIVPVTPEWVALEANFVVWIGWFFKARDTEKEKNYEAYLGNIKRTV